MTANAVLSKPWRFAACLFLAALIIIIDQWTKHLVATSTLLSAPIELTSFFNLVYVENKGAAFGILAKAGQVGVTILLIVTVIISIALLGYLWQTTAAGESLAIALILGGAIGNLIDRVRLGHVIDFLDAHWSGIHWPAFNVADSAICGGAAVWLFVLFFWNSKKP